MGKKEEVEGKGSFKLADSKKIRDVKEVLSKVCGGLSVIPELTFARAMSVRTQRSWKASRTTHIFAKSRHITSTPSAS